VVLILVVVVACIGDFVVSSLNQLDFNAAGFAYSNSFGYESLKEGSTDNLFGVQYKAV